MAGFRNIREWATASDNGQEWYLLLNKGFSPNISITGRHYDWTTVGGNPAANYYASSPLVAAVLDSGVRPYLPDVAPYKQGIRSITMTVWTSNTSATNGLGGSYNLNDYLLYYPFIDFTAVGEEQLMTNIVTLPRSSDGKGVKMMLVAQSSVVGSGSMAVTYINQDGVQKTTPTFFINSTQTSGELCSCMATASVGPTEFIPLAAGDSGVRSVVSANVITDGGGIGAIVLVKPLTKIFAGDASSRITTGTISTGSFVQVQAVIDGPPITLDDGAFLGFVGWHPTTQATSKIIAEFKTVWN